MVDPERGDHEQSVQHPGLTLLPPYRRDRPTFNRTVSSRPWILDPDAPAPRLRITLRSESQAYRLVAQPSGLLWVRFAPRSIPQLLHNTTGQCDVPPPILPRLHQHRTGNGPHDHQGRSGSILPGSGSPPPQRTSTRYLPNATLPSRLVFQPRQRVQSTSGKPGENQ